MAKVEDHEEDKALSEGWLPDDYFAPKDSIKSHWYQARQTRINLKKFEETKSSKKTRKKCKDITTQYISAENIDLDTINVIFNKYINYRNFKSWELEPLIKNEIDRKFFIVYYINENNGSWHSPIAFSFLRNVGSNSVFSTQFAWDYENPKLYLGKYANLAEIDYCIEQRKDYMYIGAGYEECCIYKSDYKGFEFWDGKIWSEDVDHYKFLCARDSKIIKLKELDEIKQHDDKIFFND